MAPVDAAVGGLRGDDELRRHVVLIVDVLPAKAVAVLLLDGAGDQDGDVLGDEVQVLHDLGAVDGGHQTALLIGAAPTADLCVGLIAHVGVEAPVVLVADTHGVNMAIVGNDTGAVAHPAQNVALRVDLHLVEAHLFHLGGNAPDDALLAAALAGDGDQVPQKPGHIRLIALGGSFDRFKIHIPCLLKTFYHNAFAVPVRQQDARICSYHNIRTKDVKQKI